MGKLAEKRQRRWSESDDKVFNQIDHLSLVYLPLIQGIFQVLIRAISLRKRFGSVDVLGPHCGYLTRWWGNGHANKAHNLQAQYAAFLGPETDVIIPLASKAVCGQNAWHLVCSAVLRHHHQMPGKSNGHTSTQTTDGNDGNVKCRPASLAVWTRKARKTHPRNPLRHASW